MNHEELEQVIYERTRDFVSRRVMDCILELIAEEREACAKVCEDGAAEFRSQKEGCRDARYDWKEDAAMECSLAIRARGEVKL